VTLISERFDVTIKAMSTSFVLAMEQMRKFLKAMGIVSPEYLEARRAEMRHIHSQYRRKQQARKRRR
jgi:hypothetical protein